MKKLKVLFVKHDGVLKANRRYLEIIAERTDWELHLIAPEYWYEPSFRKQFPFEDSSDNLQKHPIPAVFFRHPIFFKYNTDKFRDCVSKIAPDIVFISNDPYAISSYQAVRYNFGRKIIIYGIQNIKKFIPFPFSYIYNYNLKHADFFFGCNLATLEINKQRGFSGPLEYLPIGIDKNSFKRKDNFNLSDPPNIGFVGRVEDIKGIKYLVQALNQMRRPVAFTVIGRGSLENWIKKNTGSNVILSFKSFIPHEEMGDEYLKLDILAVPSVTVWRWKEQFGRVITEGMAGGVPVLGTDSGAIPDVIGDAGVIVEERNPGALARGLEKILNDEKFRSELIQKGFERVEKNFFWESIADRVIKVIKELALQNSEFHK
ncbi:MAG TPA: glycosyltransferase family 1 protein [Firmicutes bacterium]|nr:glycosyltransferase family 1 protein [Bacillota bacterium]